MYNGCSFTFFSVNEILAKSTILLNDGDIVFGHLGGWKKSIILDIVTFFCFYMVHFLEHNSKWIDCFLVLCSNVVWNPFLMKTTFTSDSSWFESVFVKIWEHLSSVPIFTFIRCIESCFFCIATYSNQRSSLHFQATVTEMNILTENDGTWQLLINSSENLKWKRWATIQEQKEKCLWSCYA